MAHYRIIKGKVERVFRALHKPPLGPTWRKLHEGFLPFIPVEREPVPAQPTGLRWATDKRVYI